jgi:transposase
LLTKQRTQLMNCLRSQLAELGIIAAPGGRGFAELSALVAAEDAAIPALLHPALQALLGQITALHGAIMALEAQNVATAKTDPVMRRLATIAGIGGLTAHAIVTAVGDGRQFRSARDFGAWCGLTRREHSSAGKRREKGISRQGERRLRKLLALGASTVMRYARRHGDRATQWQRGIPAFARAGSGAPPGQGCGSRPSRQDRAHCLGHAGLRQNLPHAQAGDPPRDLPNELRDNAPRYPQAQQPQPASSADTQPGRSPPARSPRKEQEAATAQWSGPLFAPGAGSGLAKFRLVIAPPQRAAMPGTRPAKPIGASGHPTAPTGRIHDRSRPNATAAKKSLPNGGRP